METLDIIILICFLPALYQGLTKGLVSQVVAMASVVAGAWLAFHFSEMLCTWAAQYVPEMSPTLLHVLGYIVIFCVTVLLLNLIGRLIEHIVKLALLGWLNRLAGLVFALATAALVISILIVMFVSLNTTFGFVPEETLDASIFFNPLKEIGFKVFPYLKALLFNEPVADA